MTPLSMGVGCTGLRSRGVFSRSKASTAVAPMQPRSRVKARPGSLSVTPSRPPLTGALLSLMPARNSNDSIHHFHRDGVLGYKGIQGDPRANKLREIMEEYRKPTVNP